MDTKFNPCASCVTPNICQNEFQCAERPKQEYSVEYQKVGEPPSKYHTATFDNLEDAQLWWDTIRYLHTIYYINNVRPS